MFSFYYLASMIQNNSQHQILHAVFSFYNVSTKVTYQHLIKNALLQAKKLQYDVYNMLSLMENEDILTDLRFSEGDGTLRYYLYNWASSPLENKDVGIVML